MTERAASYVECEPDAVPRAIAGHDPRRDGSWLTPILGPPQGCVTDAVVSRVCERGTKGCVVPHDRRGMRGRKPDEAARTAAVDDMAELAEKRRQARRNGREPAWEKR